MVLIIYSEVSVEFSLGFEQFDKSMVHLPSFHFIEWLAQAKQAFLLEYSKSVYYLHFNVVPLTLSFF